MFTPQVLAIQQPPSTPSFYGLINVSNIVMNRVVWNGIDPIAWNNSLTAILDPTGISQIGGTWNGTTFVPPVSTQIPEPTSTATISIIAPSTFTYSTGGSETQGTSPYTVTGTETYFVIGLQTSLTIEVNVTTGTPPFTISFPTQGPDDNTSEYIQESSSIISNYQTNLVIFNTTQVATNILVSAQINIVDGNNITTTITLPINDV